MFMSFHVLKTCIRALLYYFFFHPLTCLGHVNANSDRRTYFRVGRWVLPNLYYCQVGLPNRCKTIFLVLPKLDRCQISLSNCRSLQNMKNWRSTAWQTILQNSPPHVEICTRPSGLASIFL
jgi:hypothetical protein